MSVQTGRFNTPLLTLLDPGRWLVLGLICGAIAVTLWGFLLGSGRVSLSSASLIAVGILAVPASLKWRDDVRKLGVTATVLSVLLILQGFHTVEHFTQVVQYYLLDWPASRSLGLITAANAEWIHFSWNWLVTLGIVFLVARGLRNVFAYALIGWAVLHSVEHTYLLIRYFQVLSELNALGLSPTGATQSLPGVLGRDGVLALQSWCGRIPGLTSAPRVAVHFWWNAGEIILLVLAAHRGFPALLKTNPLKTNPLKTNLLKTKSPKEF